MTVYQKHPAVEIVQVIHGMFNVEVRNSKDQVIATGRLRLHKPGEQPAAFLFGNQVAVSTGEIIGTVRGHRWIYKIAPDASFIRDEVAR
jgi:hypothetical protein